MFVVAAAVLVSSLVDGQLRQNLLNIVILTVIGICAVFKNIDLGRIPVWEIILILLGAYYLAKTFWKVK